MQDRIIIIGEPPCSTCLSQILPLATILAREGNLVDVIIGNPVSLQIMERGPEFNELVCIKAYDEGNIVFKEISNDEGREANIGYYFMDGSLIQQVCVGAVENRTDVVLDDALWDRIGGYDRILVISDNPFPAFEVLCKQVIQKFGNKCFGRMKGWHKEFAPYKDDVYIPIETVEAFGYEWDESYFVGHPDQYKEFDHNKQFGEKSMHLTCMGGCESYMPIAFNKWYTSQKKLKKLFEAAGFDEVYLTGRTIDIREQVFYHRMKHHVTIDSIAIWLSKIIRQEVFLLYAGDDINLPKRLDCKNLIEMDKFSAMQDVPPEYIVERFLKLTKVSL